MSGKTEEGNKPQRKPILNQSFAEAREAKRLRREAKDNADKTVWHGIPLLILCLFDLFVVFFFGKEVRLLLLILCMLPLVGYYTIKFFRTQRAGLGSFTEVHLFCIACGKHISTKPTWVCTYCDQENNQTGYYSFLFKCNYCGKIPESFECPYCLTLNAFVETADPRHAACALEKGSKVSSEESSEDTLKKVESEITLTRLRTALEEAKNEWFLEQSKLKASRLSAEERVGESLKEFLLRTNRVQEEASKELRRGELEFKDDAPQLARHQMAVQAWAASEFSKLDQ